MNCVPDHENSRAVRLVEYLLRLASLRTKLVRDIAGYERVLWINDIPRQKGCFTQAWGRNEDYDSDIWVEIQNRREPELPNVPDQCLDWADKGTLRNKNDFPELLPEITREVRNLAWQEGSDQPEFVHRSERLDDHPNLQKVWDRYVEERWFPWVEEHNSWENVHKVYSLLFAIHQEQLRLGEEYELVLGLGLLTWQTPNGQRVRRHMVVANALLEFEARLGKFTVRPNLDGASVRPELHMLEIEEQPARAEEKAKTALANSADDPWEKDCIEGVLKALVHSIDSEGEYDDILETKSTHPAAKPIVEYAPAIILRKRSARGLTETLKRIKARIEMGGKIPPEFGDLAEITQSHQADYVTDPGDSTTEFDGEVFFPKPSNEEQRRIVDKIRVANGVLVQGPPGTGKSHTIANLICHLLATGQRTLITAKTPRALQVLEGLVPEELRPMCINLLGSGLTEKRSLESSVSGILRKNEDWNSNRATAELKKYEHKLRELREEKAQTDRRLRAIRESEIHSHTIADGTYRGTAAQIAQAVNRDKSALEWFTDKVPIDQSCPITEKDLRVTLSAIRRFTPEKRRELNLAWPDNLPSYERFAELVECEQKAIKEEARSATGADAQIAAHLSEIDDGGIKVILDTFSAFRDKRRRISASPHSWMREAIGDIVGGNSSLWRELHGVTRDITTSIEPVIRVADETNLETPENVNNRTLLEDAGVLKDHLENGGRLGWGPFRPKLVKERIHVLKAVRMNGRSCTNLDHISVLADVLQVRVELEKAWGFWAGRCEKIQGPYALQLQALKAACDALDDSLSLTILIEQCRDALKQCVSLPEPIWTDESQIERFVASCKAALAHLDKCRAKDNIHIIETTVTAIAAKSDAHPVTRELLEAIRNRDTDGFARTSTKVQDLQDEKLSVQKVDEYLMTLSQLIPKLIEDLEQTCSEKYWEERIHQIRSAWQWSQAKTWLGEFVRKEDAPSLAKRAAQIEEEISGNIARVASLRAWSFCFSRLAEEHRRHMEAWQQSMRRLGKGTGKHAPRHRKEAQQHLNECREAVPAWVMPLHRIWDTVDPAPEIFDVIIVDEASQCGFEAIPLFYLAKKILIVGDDKQISPEEGFIDKNAVFQLMEQFLYDFMFKDSFHRDASLFDHGKRMYGTRRITLREHFRCMPEIIRFSNDLCYRDTPLIPLRQYGPNRLPPLERFFLERGYREGSNNRAVNRPEADAIAAKIAELCRDPKYARKTMGVVVLQGNAQAGLIEDALLNLLGAEEMGKRRLICGNPYSFQGDERDIMFLSMVAAPNERIGPLTKAADERRFNVAASRARDQMYLFHSVSRDHLSSSCLRRQLVEFFEDLRPKKVGGINREELERRAAQDNRSVVKPPRPFDSWFEVDVALALLRRDFDVSPQYEVAGKRIDLVIEGGHARVAVECDGDEWHGPDQYEADMQRQRMLERRGIDWVFFRVRASAFYSNRESALQGLWHVLEEMDIRPNWFALPVGPDEEEGGMESDYIAEDEDEDDAQFIIPLPEDSVAVGGRSSRRSEGVSSSGIQEAILHALKKCPNYSCTLHSLTARVLKELGVITRGNPRLAFAKRVMRGLNILEGRELVEKYRAKNKRVRIVQSRL